MKLPAHVIYSLRHDLFITGLPLLQVLKSETVLCIRGTVLFSANPMLLSSPPTPLCFSRFCCIMGLCLFNELMSCFQRSNNVFSTHVPSSTKANYIGFEKRRVDSVEKEKDWWRERFWAFRFGRQEWLVFYSSSVLCIHHSDTIPVSGNLILQSLAKVN